MQSLIPQPMQQPIQAVPQEVPVTSDELYATYLQEERIKNILTQISPDNQLMEIQWRIKGYIRNPVTQQWEKIDKDGREPHPLLVSRFISYLSSVLNQNTTMSNLSSVEINKIMKLAIEWIVDDLKSNAEVYGLKDDYTERTRVGHIILNETFIAMKRAQDGMESRRIFKSLMMTENFSPAEKKRGLLDYLKVWK